MLDGAGERGLLQEKERLQPLGGGGGQTHRAADHASERCDLAIKVGPTPLPLCDSQII